MSRISLLSTGLMLLLTLYLSSCRGTAPVALPESLERVDTLIQRALRLEQKGLFDVAAATLQEALTLSSSVENFPRMVVARINLARLARARGDLSQALQYSNEALSQLAGAPSFRAETYHEQAQVLLALDQAESALTWAEQAVATAPAPDRGRHLNVLGKIRLKRDEFNAARTALQEALKLHRTSGDLREQANSLRMLGMIDTQEHNCPDAETRLHEALTIDTQLADSLHMGFDLEELAIAAYACGNSAAMKEYRERAIQIHLHGGRAERARQLRDRRDLQTNTGTALSRLPETTQNQSGNRTPSSTSNPSNIP